MATTPQNLLVIMSDEHNPKVAGYAGDPVVATPNLDGLAARGTRFTAAYTDSPICVPARASFITGLPVHRHRCWDNAIAYDGSIPSWARALRDRGHHVASIGKLHYQGHPGQDYGFTETILPMQIANGRGDITHLIRDPEDTRNGAGLLGGAKPGESTYSLYDRQVASAASVWLRETGARRHDKPWVLFVSLVCPHFPLTAPPEHWYRYAGRDDLPWPKLYAQDQRPRHPYVRNFARRSDYDRHFQDPEDVRRALTGYYGLVSYLDEQVGRILAALKAAGLEGSTRIAYTSDHGDNLGARGLWGKATMYEESAGIPMILAGEGVPAGAVSDSPVVLTDLSATILDAVGEGDAPAALGMTGNSLLGLARTPGAERAVLAEFHTYGPDGLAMLRTRRWKYVRYLGAPDQLFDMQADPEELHDLGEDPAHAAVRAELRARLAARVDLEAADRQAKADQAAMIARHGGEAAVRATEKAGFTPPPSAGGH
jgi:choline-sulfatase